ncbi:3-deoxy-manno-octulosonate cytidylyltransferase [Acetobacteraceae bacterium]|nr:3-deoxy-manno-octulosonate cytidylyltransferase [Acetobacteraceae bacterium]
MPPVVCIPARMNSSRLPGKMLADIGGKPMIRHVAEAASQGGIYPVFVVADHPYILEAIKDIENVKGILLEKSYQSGSDRIQGLLDKVDPQKAFDIVINLQGDMPFISPCLIQEVLKTLSSQSVDLGTLVAPLSLEAAKAISKVKVACAFTDHDKNARALYFSRNIVPCAGKIWEHVGIYAWRRSSLERFVAATPSLLEQQESLEQLRALELGMRIDCRRIELAPISVDVPQDLENVRIAYDKMGVKIKDTK